MVGIATAAESVAAFLINERLDESFDFIKI
jgi:hypothetical protein